MTWRPLLLPLLLILAAPVAAQDAADDFPVRRCVNLGNALEAERFEGEWGFMITPEVLDWVAAEGFDTVRLPVRFSAHWRDGRIDDWILGRVDQVISQATDRGLTVILDLHHYVEMNEFPEREAGKFAAIWKELALHYADWGDGLIFELLNEPAGALTTKHAVALYRDVLPAIRESNPDRWIIVGGDDWSNVDTLPDLPDLGWRVMPTFHFYEPWEFTHQGASWIENPPPPRGWGDAADWQEFEERFGIAARHPGPVFLGEFGAIDTIEGPDRLTWIRAVREAAEAAGIGWCVWAVEAGFAIRDRSTGDWVPGMRAALMGD